ncbi:protein of unknown function [Aminobacter niigataensis]|nr:protein of unknown function [Aminobacter niigataensis]
MVTIRPSESLEIDLSCPAGLGWRGFALGRQYHFLEKVKRPGTKAPILSSENAQHHGRSSFRL